MFPYLCVGALCSIKHLKCHIGSPVPEALTIGIAMSVPLMGSWFPSEAADDHPCHRWTDTYVSVCGAPERTKG